MGIGMSTTFSLRATAFRRALAGTRTLRLCGLSRFFNQAESCIVGADTRNLAITLLKWFESDEKLIIAQMRG
jgi:hypothetical protein